MLTFPSEISWAGNPYEKIVTPGHNYLDPRAGFQRWRERVVGTSREWTEDQGIHIHMLEDRAGLTRNS